MKIQCLKRLKFQIILCFLWNCGAHACDIPLGKYNAVLEESDYLLSVEIDESGLAKIVQEYIHHSNRIFSDKKIYSAYWSCKGSSFELEYSVEKIIGKILKDSLKESFGIDASSATIVFPQSQDPESVVGGWQFWPGQFIQNAFQ